MKKLPQQCPNCGTSLRDRTVPARYRRRKKQFTRAIEVLEDGTPTDEATNIWMCPDCGHIWDRAKADET